MMCQFVTKPYRPSLSNVRAIVIRSNGDIESGMVLVYNIIFKSTEVSQLGRLLERVVILCSVGLGGKADAVGLDEGGVEDLN